MSEGYFVGNYDGLATAGTTFVACFTVTSAIVLL
jgi:hypothetical protein